MSIEKVKTLTAALEAKYSMFGENAKVAAQYALSDMLGIIRGQEQYADQLLDEFIENAKR
jgi:hypothetical protein